MLKRTEVVFNKDDELVRVDLLSLRNLIDLVESGKCYTINALGDTEELTREYMDSLLDIATDGNSFYINPDDSSVVEIAWGIPFDTVPKYITTAISEGFSERTMALLSECWADLERCGFSRKDLFTLVNIKGVVRLKYFNKDLNKNLGLLDPNVDKDICYNKDYGFLDPKDDRDMCFKLFVNSVYNDIGKCAVIVLPCKGTAFLFEDTLIAYRTNTGFLDALKEVSYDMPKRRLGIGVKRRWKNRS